MDRIQDSLTFHFVVCCNPYLQKFQSFETHPILKSLIKETVYHYYSL